MFPQSRKWLKERNGTLARIYAKEEDGANRSVDDSTSTLLSDNGTWLWQGRYGSPRRDDWEEPTGENDGRFFSAAEVRGKAAGGRRPQESAVPINSTPLRDGRRELRWIDPLAMDVETVSRHQFDPLAMDVETTQTVSV